MSDACCGGEPVAQAVPTVGSGKAYRITGLCCAEEVAVLKRALAGLVHEEQLGFDVLNGRMWVRADIPAQGVIAAVSGTGMKAEPWSERIETAGRAPGGGLSLRDSLVLASALFTAVGFASHAATAGLRAALGSEGAGLAETVPWLPKLAYLAAVGSGLWLVLPKAWYAARSLRPDMNLLMTTAVAGAIALGELFEAATVATLFSLSLSLEAFSVGRARRAVEALMKLAPDTVRVERGGIEVEVDPSTVPPDTAFSVHPGERIGLDGIVIDGRSEVDQAPITGESMPVAKSVGDTVFAGTINGAGALTVLSTKRATETTLARIVRQVSSSASRRAPSERWVDRFARTYTPAILSLSVAVAVLPPLLLGAPWSEWIYRALVLLVIGCPCALVIATPVAIVCSLAASARRGVLLKGGRVVELPASLVAVALDKTGTLTQGRLAVVDVVPLDGLGESVLLAKAAALESRSQHPIAAAILEHARKSGVTATAASSVTADHGKGLSGRIDGRTYWLGSPRLLEERGQETPELRARIEVLSSAGRSVAVLGDDERALGLITVADAVRPEAAAAIAALRRAGVRRVVLLTGDNRATAMSVGALVGIDDVQAELLPEDKVRAVEALEREFGPVAMIGDGVNDAPALARATLGVAMGAIGTDVAIETADVALMGDDLGKLAWLVEHSRQTLRIIRANAALALGIKALFMLLTFLGAASLWGAIVADMGASLLVVANAMRLLRR